MAFRSICCTLARRYHRGNRRGDRVRRRDFITLVGGAAAAWPLRAGAQQLAIPVIGFLSARFPNDSAANVTTFHRGLGKVGFLDGQNVEIDFRWAFGHYDQLPGLAANLVRRRVAAANPRHGNGSHFQCSESY
jgi:hypothetical protein